MDLAISGEPHRYLKGSHVPTLILAGEKDRLFPQHFLKFNISPLTHCHHITIPGASSFLVLDKPKITAMLMLDFIKENPGKNTSGKDQLVTALYEEIRAFTNQILEDVQETLHINVIQPFQVYINGEERLDGWNKRSAKPILIYMLFHRSSTRDQLCDALWPDIPLPQAKKNLSVYLSYLKKMLTAENGKQPFLSTDRHHIHLNGKVTSDALDFMALLKSAADETNPEKKYIKCGNLLNSLPLTFTPVTYEDWFISLMNQIRARLIHLILWMADWLLQSGKDQQALHHLRNYMHIFNEDDQISDKIVEEFGAQ